MASLITDPPELVDSEDVRECLICGTCILPTNLTLNSLSSSWSQELPGAEGSCQVNRDLWALFILKNLLGYNQERMENLLGSVGISMGNWFVVCDTCRGMVEEAMKAYQQLLRLQGRLRERLKRDRGGFGGDEQDEVVDLGKVIRRQLQEDLDEKEVVLLDKVQDEEDNDMEEQMDEWSPPQEPQENDSEDEKKPKVRRKPGRKPNKVKVYKGKKRGPKPKPKPEKTETEIIKKKRRNKRKIYTCEQCGLKLRFEDKYNYHLIIHKYFENCEEIDNKLKCKICGDLLGGPVLLRRHTRTKHAAELGIPIYQCHLCPKVYHIPILLSDHITEVHTKNGRYNCQTCGYSTNKRETYEKHLISHSQEKPVICHLCGASFKTDFTLKLHVKKVHSEKRRVLSDSFPCKYCTGLFFDSKSILLRHLKDKHKDLYQYSCDQCENAYISQSSLHQHKEIKHSGGKLEVECPYCGVKVGCQQYLNQHFRHACKNLPEGFSPSTK